MIDARLLPVQRRILAPVARRLQSAGVTADALTLVGFALGLLAVAAVATRLLD